MRLLFASLAAVAVALAADAQADRVRLESAVRLRPGDAQAWLELAQVYAELKQGALASQAASKAGSLGASDIRILQPLAFFYFKAGNIAKAAETQARYARLPGADSNATLRAVELYTAAGRAKDAVAFGRRAIEQQPERADVRNSLAKAFALDGQPTAAIREFEAAIRLDPYSEPFRFDLVQYHLHREQFTEAAQTIEAARTVFDKSAQLELAMGVAQYGLRRFSEAASSFLRTIELSPDVEQPYLFLARMLDQAGPRLSEIRARANEFAARRPDSAVAQYVYARTLAASGGSADAIEERLRKALALNPALWEAHFELGSLAESKSAFADAARSFETAARLNPKEASIPYRLARVYDRLGDRTRAAAARSRHAALTASKTAK